MSNGVPAKVIAATLGLSAFAIAVVCGLYAGNPAETILLRAIIAMIVVNLLGLAIGGVAERAIAEGIAAYKERRAADSANVRSLEGHAPAPVSAPASTSRT